MATSPFRQGKCKSEKKNIKTTFNELEKQIQNRDAVDMLTKQTKK